MATLMVYKRNSKFIDLSELIEELGSLGLTGTLEKYYNKPLEKQARSIVAGPSFLQFLNGLFQIQITAGDIIHLESLITLLNVGLEHLFSVIIILITTIQRKL